VAAVAGAASGCAHPGVSPAPPTTPPAATAEPFGDPTGMMIALEDVRGIYLPKRPRLVPLDDAAYGEACLKNQHAVAWHIGQEADWQASGRAEHAEAGFRSACLVSITFYERAGDRVVIRRDTFARLPRPKQVELVAHELVHALQAHALPPPPQEMTTDARFALTALVEGDANVTTLAFVLKLEGKSLSSELARVWTGISAREARSLGDHRFFEDWLGARFVLELYQRGGFAAVDDAFAHPPKSTAEIIHANRYLEPQAPPTNVSTRLPLPAPFVAFGSLVFGERGIRELLAQCVTPAVAMEVGAEWDGDEITLAKSPPSATSATSAPSVTPFRRWVTAWRSEEAAKRFGEVVGASNSCLFRGGASIAARGRVVVIVTGAEAAVRQRHAREVLADVLQPRAAEPDAEH
jgi:hypothetical protein